MSTCKRHVRFRILSKIKSFVSSLVCIKKNIDEKEKFEVIETQNSAQEETCQDFPEVYLHILNSNLKEIEIKRAKNADVKIQDELVQTEPISSMDTLSSSIIDAGPGLFNISSSSDSEGEIILEDHISNFGDYKNSYRMKDLIGLVNKEINPTIQEYYSITEEFNNFIIKRMQSSPSIEKSFEIFRSLSQSVEKMHNLLNNTEAAGKIKFCQESLMNSKKKHYKISQKKMSSLKNKNKPSGSLGFQEKHATLKLPDKENSNEYFFDSGQKKFFSFDEIVAHIFQLNSLKVAETLGDKEDLIKSLKDSPSNEIAGDLMSLLCQMACKYHDKVIVGSDHRQVKVAEEHKMEKSKVRASTFCHFYKQLNKIQVDNKNIAE